jgi:DNA mismatch repair protein MutS2
MARRLGLDPALVERAAGLVGREEQDVQALLTQLETTRRDLEAEKARVEEEIARADDVRTKYEERVRKLTADYQAVKARAGRESERLLAKAGDLLKEAEAEARSIKQRALIESKDAKLRLDQLKGSIREVKESAAHLARPETAAPGRPVDPTEARPGERFWAEPLQSWVTIVAPPEGQKVRVERNGLRVELPVTALRTGLAGAGAGAAVRRSALDELPRDESKPRGGVSWTQPDKPMLEVDLRGLTAEEALDRLDHFLDEAMLSGAPEIRIIHGKGTGALRTAVRKWLTGRTDIVSHRLGETYEGGTGVTVAKLE